MQIKKQTDQAIRILVYLANRHQIMVGKELAGLVGVSEKYLPYIMQRLRQAGLILSSSGISGGYALAKHAKEITLLDVMTATSDEPQINCYSEGKDNSSRYDDSDVLLKNYEIVRHFATLFFNSLTIWHLSDPKRLNDFYAGMNQIIRAMEINMQVPESRRQD